MGDEVDNPQAFPREGKFREIPNSSGTLETLVTPQEGMTLRDYIATQLVSAIIQRRAAYKLKPVETVQEAYEFADTMLKARKTIE